MQASQSIDAEPRVNVGIVHAKSLKFDLHGPFLVNGTHVSGPQEVSLKDGVLLWKHQSFSELTFTPQKPQCSFLLYDVEIGIQFHWQQLRDEKFRGTLRLIVDQDQVCAINEVGVEEYVLGVGISEMKSTAPLEYVKTQVVIARSWLLAQMQAGTTGHTAYDVCADDHCQRYQGTGRRIRVAVREAVESTRGEVLTYEGQLCDTRYSKCCGGMSERFDTCWEDTDVPYLRPVRCYLSAAEQPLPSLADEAAAAEWINDTHTQVCCNTQDRALLRTILNDYDQTTTNFFRWTETYTTAQISNLVNRRLATPIGTVRELIPLRRGASGRISLLRIVGSEGSVEVSKELAIRRILSPTHLKSSAFLVEKNSHGFVLHGAGWGHGVGLCQIGAAVMAKTQGADYRTILKHYYQGADISRWYS